MKVFFDVPKIKAFIENLYLITPCRIALFDDVFREIYTYSGRLSDFCKILRENETLLAECQKCDQFHFERCKKYKTTECYACHMGLQEIIVPIILKDKIVGYLMAGQIYHKKDDRFDFKPFADKLESFSFDLEQLNHSFSMLYTATPTQLEAIKQFLDMCVSYMCSHHLVGFNEDIRKEKIDTYILAHLNEEITVAQLCAEFGYTKTMFYRMTNELYGTPIMQHIKDIRMKKAKELLLDTTMKIQDIADATGCYDYNYFSKVFRQEVHCTPREYRKNRIKQ